MPNKFPEKFLEQKSLTLNSLQIQLNLPPIRTDVEISNPSVKKILKKVFWLSLVSPIYIDLRTSKVESKQNLDMVLSRDKSRDRLE